jgi:hypothetical protein
VGLFRRDQENGKEPVVPVTDGAPPVDLMRFALDREHVRG